MATETVGERPTPNLEESYRVTDYVICLDSGDLHFHIDRRCDQLRSVLKANNVTSACFVTAANPASVLRPERTNQRASLALIEEVERRGYDWIPGVARDPTDAWPDEDSILVLGADGKTAIELGRHFGQLAIVWIDKAGMPTLHWTGADIGLR